MKPIKCRFCNSNDTIYLGKDMFRCNACKKVFTKEGKIVHSSNELLKELKNKKGEHKVLILDEGGIIGFKDKNKSPLDEKVNLTYREYDVVLKGVKREARIIIQREEIRFLKEIHKQLGDKIKDLEEGLR